MLMLRSLSLIIFSNFGQGSHSHVGVTDGDFHLTEIVIIIDFYRLSLSASEPRSCIPLEKLVRDLCITVTRTYGWKFTVLQEPLRKWDSKACHDEVLRSTALKDTEVWQILGDSSYSFIWRITVIGRTIRKLVTESVVILYNSKL